MLIKMNWKPDNLLLKEHSNGAITVASLSGKYITVIDGRMNGLRNYLEKIDKIQGQRIKKGIAQ